ncbi:MAG TPA: hypothetical protein PKO06_11585 [Candidatus Ozemobacteraceae bacterium]|nr:hypothetical protein [Candidatus Ozemobacteraceae bacterium]
MKAAGAVRTWVWASLLLVLAAAALWSAKAREAARAVEPAEMAAIVGARAAVPLVLRQVAAGFCLEQAETCLHRGAELPGAAQGRTPAVLFWLSQALAWHPEHLEVWETLGNEYFNHFGDFRLGRHVLQEGIRANPRHPRRHALWAAVGIACWYQAVAAEASDTMRFSGIKYLRRAEEDALGHGLSHGSEPVMNVRAYAVFQARLHAELGDFDASWRDWQRAGEETKADSELGRLLRDWKQGADPVVLRREVLDLRRASALAPATSLLAPAPLVTDALTGCNAGCEHAGHQHQTGGGQHGVEPDAAARPATEAAMVGRRVSVRLGGTFLLLSAALLMRRRRRVQTRD